jgi:hypothetical protein
VRQWTEYAQNNGELDMKTARTWIGSLAVQMTCVVPHYHVLAMWHAVFICAFERNRTAAGNYILVTYLKVVTPARSGAICFVLLSYRIWKYTGFIWLKVGTCPCFEAVFLASGEILRLSWNPRVHYRVHKGPPNEPNESSPYPPTLSL